MLTDPNALAKQAWEDAERAGEDAYIEAVQTGVASSDIAMAKGAVAAQAAIAAVYAPRIAELEAEVARLREALVATEGAIAEYYRYWTGGEMRGSYDGKPERASLWKSRQTARTALGASHD